MQALKLITLLLNKRDYLLTKEYIKPVISGLYLLGVKVFQFLETFLSRRRFILQNNLNLIVFEQQMDGLTGGSKGKFRLKRC